MKQGEGDRETCPLSSSWWEEELECQPSVLNCWAILLPIHHVHVTQVGAVMGTKISSLPPGKHCLVEMMEHTQKLLIRGGCIWYSIRGAEGHGSVGEGKNHYKYSNSTKHRCSANHHAIPAQGSRQSSRSRPAVNWGSFRMWVVWNVGDWAAIILTMQSGRLGRISTSVCFNIICTFVLKE